MKRYISVINVVIPTLLFYCIYITYGISIAIIISIVYSIVVMTYNFFIKKKVCNTQIIGVIGLVVSYISILFTNNEKYYYVPALINNCIFAGIVLILALKKKSIIHFIAKDFNLNGIKNVEENSILNLNFIWLAYFFLKYYQNLLVSFILILIHFIG